MERMSLVPRYRIVGSVLLFLSAVHRAWSTIIAVSDINITVHEEFDDLQSQFGSLLPLEGLRGYVIPAVPGSACTALTPPPVRDNTTIFIALIRRYECNFDVKVLQAQEAGFDAAIVHNVNSETLLSMDWNEERVRRQISIPSVFIGASAGRALTDTFSYYSSAHIVIIRDLSFNLGYYLIPFVVVVAVIITVMCAVMVVRCVQHRKRLRRYRLSKDQLKKIPIHAFKKGDGYEVCAICLEEYEEGDKLRVLPCSHAYHCSCVDPWLTQTKKTCPVCKHRVLRSEDDSDTEEEGNTADDERTPLLHPSPSFGSMAECPQAQQGSTTAVAV